MLSITKNLLWYWNWNCLCSEFRLFNKNLSSLSLYLSVLFIWQQYQYWKTTHLWATRKALRAGFWETQTAPIVKHLRIRWFFSMLYGMMKLVSSKIFSSIGSNFPGQIVKIPSTFLIINCYDLAKMSISRISSGNNQSIWYFYQW